MVICNALMTVSGVCFPILNFCTDSCVVVKMHGEGEHLDTGEGSEDSDCEGILEQPNGSAQEVQDDKKEEPESLPILIVGSFARCAHRRWQTQISDPADSWKSLFFYLCTDTIQFAPLKSQGIHVRAQYVQEETTPGQPPPCSPKVICSLATSVSFLVPVHCFFGVTRHSTFSLGSRVFGNLRIGTYSRNSPPRILLLKPSPVLLPGRSHHQSKPERSYHISYHITDREISHKCSVSCYTASSTMIPPPLKA